MRNAMIEANQTVETVAVSRAKPMVVPAVGNGD
jgi:hypothetical protein